MELSIFVAKIIGVAYISMSFGMLTSRTNFQKMYKDMIKSQGLIILSGLFALIIGFLLVEHHNIWVKDWPVVITIIGWASLLKGVMLLAFPNSGEWFEPIFTGKFIKVMPYFTLAFGLIMAYYGFVA